jgi:hypothetical protein
LSALARLTTHTTAMMPPMISSTPPSIAAQIHQISPKCFRSKNPNDYNYEGVFRLVLLKRASHDDKKRMRSLRCCFQLTTLVSGGRWLWRTFHCCHITCLIVGQKQNNINNILKIRFKIVAKARFFF